MKFKIKRSKQDKDPIEVEYDFGEDLQEARVLFDGKGPLEQVVYGLYITAARQQLSDFVRKTLAKPDVTLAILKERLKDWKPTVEKRASANVERAKKTIAELSPDEKQALMAELSA